MYDSTTRFETTSIGANLTGSLLVNTNTTSGISSSADDLVIGSISDTVSRGLTIATSADCTIRFADAGDNAMGRIQYLNDTDVMTLHTANVQRLRIDADGLKFGSDTSADNALDDYEEGTWTPAITASAGNSATTSIYHASYTKVGNQVFITAYVGAGANSSTGGLWTITGLPFTSKSNNHYFTVSVGYWNSLAGNINYLTGTVQPGDTAILMRGTSGSTTSTSNLAYSTYVGNGTEFLFSATYLTA